MAEEKNEDGGEVFEAKAPDGTVIRRRDGKPLTDDEMDQIFGGVMFDPKVQINRPTLADGKKLEGGLSIEDPNSQVSRSYGWSSPTD